VVGQSKGIHPIVRDEIYRTGSEAIRNACMHSAGSRLEVELSYGQDLAIRIRDDGVGIDPDVADQGKEEHFGLQGMRERVARVGGALILVSSVTSGTSIAVTVPGSIAFRKSTSRPIEKLRAILRLKGSTPTRK
jgi:signal transduction histidine kinase